MEYLNKYPRTFHLEFSECLTSDDKYLKDLSSLIGQEIAVSIKWDGECTTAYNSTLPINFHARSVDSNNHESRNVVKGYLAERQHNIPMNWRVCGENIYARHSIIYDDLETYFYCFNIWDENNMCLSLDETVEYCELLDIIHVPILYRGIFDINILEKIFKETLLSGHEGIVVRNVNTFHYNDFSENVAKAVRENHVQTTEHWTKGPIIPNKLKI